MAGSWGSMSLNILSKINLAKYTSWLIGGEAEYFCLPTNLEQMREALAFAKKNNLAITILGGGSNVLVSDFGINGLTICMRYFSQIAFNIQNDKILIDCLAGTAKSELLKIFLKNQLAPSLFLAGLPGDVGGGVVMNAGVAEDYTPHEFMELVDAIEVMTLEGEIKELKKSDLIIKYRSTSGWQPHIVIRVKISWPYQQNTEILGRVREANKARLSKQPLDMPSCGSVFKNPVGYKAAKLIDQCGLKGYKIGDAQISLKHANFIVNLNKAKAIDVWSLILHVQKTVKEKTSINMSPEVIRLGKWNY